MTGIYQSARDFWQARSKQFVCSSQWIDFRLITNQAQFVFAALSARRAITASLVHNASGSTSYIPHAWAQVSPPTGSSPLPGCPYKVALQQGTKALCCPSPLLSASAKNEAICSQSPTKPLKETLPRQQERAGHLSFPLSSSGKRGGMCRGCHSRTGSGQVASKGGEPPKLKAALLPQLTFMLWSSLRLHGIKDLSERYLL